MAGLLDQSGAFVGYPQLQRQAAKMRTAAQGRIPENLPDPRTYGFVSGLLGTSPDQLGMSVLSPNTQAAKEAAYYGYQLGNAAQIAPAVTPAARAFGRGLMTLGPSEAAAFSNPMSQRGVISTGDLSYRGSHLAPNAKTYGATLDDLTKILPDDVYSQQGKQLYGIGDRLIDSEWRIAALKARGKPNAEVEVYRAVPKGVKDINEGDWVSTSKAYAKQHGESALNGEYDIISKKVKAKTLSTEGYPYEYGYNTSFDYPQEEALRLAQQRAALPVEQGGLGLLAENTPEMRAQAMGFDLSNPQYHATDVDFSSIRPSLQGKLGAGVYVSPSSQYAEKYTSLNAAGNARVLPLVARGKLADDDVAMNIAESIRQEMYAQNPNFSVSEWKKRTTQALTDAGYDGRSMSGLENVITNPSNLRSRFAAFDPFRKDVATATAMGVALPDLLAAENNQQPQSAGLLYPLP